MTYQTICVGLLQEDDRNEAVMETAIEMALTQGAHLTGVYLVPTLNIPIYVAMPFPDDIMSSYYEAADAGGKELREIFGARCNSAGIESNEWLGGPRSILTPLEELAPVTVLLAWTPRRECTRAVRDALPLLRAAHQVVVLVRRGG
ncbi:MAG: hypothetical protein P8M28_07620 [Alphaproteobacteria bacterium]|nr:hypothetical protein [Alphaproteobacteria bacterium]